MKSEMEAAEAAGKNRSALVEPDIADWDDAYANRAHIPGAQAFVDAWPVRAAAFRDGVAKLGRLRAGIAYGSHERERFDLFLPEAAPKGLVVFVHGGYWMYFDRSDWSHLAAGPLEAGYAVAMPSYALCPEVRISDIVRQIAQATGAAAGEVEGPLHLAGHSAGGHLVSRMVSGLSPLAPAVLERVARVLSISGVHDLRPLMKTRMNATLRLDPDEATAQSPVLLRPVGGVATTVWVGADERPEFIRQTRMMGEAWGARTVVEPGRHHFDVVEGLTDRNHPLVRALLAV